jgi:hypothetical protein
MHKAVTTVRSVQPAPASSDTWDRKRLLPTFAAKTPRKNSLIFMGLVSFTAKFNLMEFVMTLFVLAPMQHLIFKKIDPHPPIENK